MDKLNIVVTDRDTVTRGADDIDISVIEAFGSVTYYGATSPEELVERVKDADIILCNKTPITADVMSSCSKLKYIGLFATGFNNIDVEYAGKNGITVCNAGSYSTDAVAQLVFSFILEVYTNTSKYAAYTAEGRWMSSPTFSAFVFPQSELSGKTLGILGYGSIGKKVARIANAFGMNVVVTTRTAQVDDSVRFVTFDELLGCSDIITAHCPLTEATQGIFGEMAFALMKDGAVFINTSRGPVVNEYALRTALDSGKLRAACLDVLAAEPMRSDCPLFGAKNLIITPHIGWAPTETRTRLIEIVCKNLEAWIGGTPVNVVSR